MGSQTFDSCQDGTESIESMDSLDASYASMATTEASNARRTHRQDRFFLEHLDFLAANTQPREVEIVYKHE